jgi:hypothetical protein
VGREGSVIRETVKVECVGGGASTVFPPKESNNDKVDNPLPCDMVVVSTRDLLSAHVALHRAKAEVLAKRCN